MNDTLLSSIFAVLNGDAGLTAIVGDRIYPVKADQTASFPYVVFLKVSGTIGIHMKGASNDREARIQFDIYSKNYTNVEDIRKRLVALIHGQTGTFGSTELWVGQLLSDEDSFTHQADTFSPSLDFMFNYEVSLT